MNRKGFALASVFLQVVLLFLVAVGAIFAWYFMSQVDDSFSNDPNFDADAAQLFSDSTDKLDDTFDNVVLVLMIGVTLGLAITSFVLRSNPAMFVLVLLIVVIVGMVAGYLSNSWNDVTSGPFEDVVTNFPITEFMMQNYMVVTLVNSFLMLIVFFAKPGGGGEF